MTAAAHDEPGAAPAPDPVPDGMTGTRHGTVIVGAGFAGMGLAIRLTREGHDDYVLLEKAASPGGTWRDNTYPGCACDIPSHLYSYSFALNPHWSRRYPGQPEIERYLHEVAERFGVTRHIRFGAEVISARYDDERREWTVITRGGDRYTAPTLVLATGPLHQPAIPDLPGLASFAGPVFHSARWDHHTDLTGKTIAVIGTGASAVQFVPQLAGRVAGLSVFQRTPPWVIPRGDRAFSARFRRLAATVPGLARAYRASIYWRQEARAVGFTVAPGLLRLAQGAALRHLRNQVADEGLRRALTPDYTMGCKRVLLSDDYYPALARPGVRLVTTPIARVEPDAVVTTDGTRHLADVIVCGTGFHVTDSLMAMPVHGSGGRALADAWRDGVQAYLGMTVAGFPNLFFMVGPNSGLGHNSIVFMIEAQARYIAAALSTVRSGRAELAVDPAVQARFNGWVQRRMHRTVWTSGGCRSWYLDPDGVNRTLWPGFTVSYWLRTRRLRLADFPPTVPDGPPAR